MAKIGTTEICVTIFKTEMHVTELKTGANKEIASNENDMRRGTMTTMVPTMTSPTNTIP
jgi:hypothetical protein